MAIAWIVVGIFCVLSGIWLKFAQCDAFLLFANLVQRRDSNAFKDKVVWITGASGSLGYLLAQSFAERGAKLILSARNEERLKALIWEIAKECGGSDRVHVLPFDLRKADWDEIAASALSSFPEGIDYVVQNAGMSQHSLAAETKAYLVDELFQLNTIGPIALTQALLPGMLKQGKGQFVVISSMAAKIPSPGQAIYSGTKFAVVGYFHALRMELAASPIGVTICCPGPFNFGSQKATRVVYHSEGPVMETVLPSHGLSAQHVARLIVLATELRLRECWMTNQPILLIGYIMQYFPVLGAYILDKQGPGRAAGVKKGDGYSMKAMFGKAKAV